MNFRHIRPSRFGTVLPHGGYTIAMERSRVFVSYAIATCSSEDNFSYSLGRTVAARRLEVAQKLLSEHKVVSALVTVLPRQIFSQEGIDNLSKSLRLPDLSNELIFAIIKSLNKID